MTDRTKEILNKAVADIAANYEESEILMLQGEGELPDRNVIIEIIKEILAQPMEDANGGALVSFESNEPRYSYAALGEDGFVTRTAEKEVISNHALCGAYFFSTGKRFKEIAHRLLSEPEFKKPEYYVSLLYNYLLADGEKVCLASMEEYYSYGTPEELKRYM